MNANYQVLHFGMAQERFCLKWNDFQSTVAGSFGALRKEEDFFDVTLVSDDEKQMHAHKLVLSACSSFFKTILRRNAHSHPMVYLSGVNSVSLGFILDYIYEGEVKIYQEQLDTFLHDAQKLKIEGLMSDNVQDDSYIKDEIKINSKDDSIFFHQEITENPVTVTPRREIARANLNLPSNIDEIEQKIEELTDRIDGVWTCKVCGKTSGRKLQLGWHIESHIEGLSFPCNGCDKTFRTRDSLRNHVYKFHK